MQAINFVARGNARGVVYGSVGAPENNSLSFVDQQEISLNLARHNVASYTRVGDAFVLTLSDGREIVLEGYFAGF